MKVFITGATGFIGSAVTAELLRNGHDVTGLARSADAERRVTGAGAAALRGSLDDLDVVRAGAEAADGVVHLGFKHDFSDMAEAGRTERAVVTALGEALADSGRPLVIASGIGLLAPGRLLTEDDRPVVSGPEGPRGGGESLALSFAEKGVRSVSARFAPTVHGEGDHGFVAELARVAREHGVVGHVGDGANLWPAVHRHDAAALVRLALESAPAATVVHGVAEGGVPTRSIAEALGRRLDLPTASIAPEDVPAHFGWIGSFFALDIPASSERTRRLLGWEPGGPGLLADIEAGHYDA